MTQTVPWSAAMRACTPRFVIWTSAIGRLSRDTLSSAGLDTLTANSVPPARPGPAPSRSPVTRLSSLAPATATFARVAVPASSAHGSSQFQSRLRKSPSNESGTATIVVYSVSTLVCCTASVRSPSRSTSMRP